MTAIPSSAHWVSAVIHHVAWRVRKALGLDKVPAGVTDKANDAIIYEVDATGKSGSGYSHPKCGHSEDPVANQIGQARSAANSRLYPADGSRPNAARSRSFALSSTCFCCAGKFFPARLI